MSKLSRVNFHVIFSEELDPEVIENQFLHALSSRYTISPEYEDLCKSWHASPTRESLSRLGELIVNSVPEGERRNYGSPFVEGFNNFTLELGDILDALMKDAFVGKHLTAVGKVEWADIKWNDHSVADKKSIINSSHIVFTAAPTLSSYHNSLSSLSRSGVNSRLLDCSDAHHYSDSSESLRLGNCMTWIKADPTFQGLRLALEEFEHRVFVGDVPPQVQRERLHGRKILDSVEIRAALVAHDPWFDCNLLLNSGLVAVIGNKGGGKSALADILALVSGTRRTSEFSFLTSGRFRNSKTCTPLLPFCREEVT